MKRIFVAVDISEQAREIVTSYMENLRRQFPDVRVGWDKPEKLHLTLRFLGDTSNEQLAELKTIVARAAGEISNFKIEIARTGVFPNPRSARVLWIDVIDGQGNLSKLNRMLEDGCERLGFSREKRKFVPHLTIGRIREPGKAGDLAARHLATMFGPVEMKVSEAVIYRSVLHPSGSVYQKVESFELKTSL
jgi:2'-5' RNA ligase